MVEICDPEFDFISKLVYDHSRISLGLEKKQLVCARLNKRLAQLGLPTFADYCDFLKSKKNQDEITLLIDAISTNFTQFFREMDHFVFLQDQVLPEFKAQLRSRPSRPFQVWSAACSTGEEPYSLAILLDDFFQASDGCGWKMLATDISTRVLEKAQEGVYEISRLKFPQDQWLSTYFQKGKGKQEGYARIKARLKAQIEFQHLNLLQPYQLPETQFDLIFCRNVMIYFDHETIRTLAETLYHKLVPGGYLLIGHAENLKQRPEGLKQLESSIFRKVLPS